MYELSLFSGAGGGLLGTHLLGWEPVGYVENDDYCQRVIAARIADGILRDAPIFGDIRAFISEGYADSYSGLVDVVSAGFPCQPFSVAGQRKGDADDRNLWPETIDVIRRVRPRFASLENVPGLLAHPYARRIYGDLAESGYDCQWRRLSAAETGAPHRRDRWWCIAHTNQFDDDNGRLGTSEIQRQRSATTELCRSKSNLAYAACQPERKPPDKADADPITGQARNEPGDSGECFPDAKRNRLERVIKGRAAPGSTDGPRNGRDSGWWSVEPDVG